MISTSKEYRAAITGDSRRVLLKAVVDITDPDVVYGEAQGSAQAAFSNAEQLHNKTFDLTPYATLERNRWLLNGKMKLIPDAGADGETGFVSQALSGDDGAFSTAQWVEMRFSNVSNISIPTAPVAPTTATLLALPIFRQLRFCLFFIRENSHNFFTKKKSV